VKRCGVTALLGLLLCIPTTQARAQDGAAAENAAASATACAAPADAAGDSDQPAADTDEPDDAVERIDDFASRVVVDAAGALTITETITVEAAGDKINHGIYRDFPTLYDGPWGTRRGVPFAVVAVERDGRAEPYHLGDQDNGVRVYIGDSTIELPHGQHRYALTYRTGLQLGFFPDHDELYWNVTGNGWMFPIDHASARVELPPDVPRPGIRLDGYTGPQGSTQQYLKSAIGADGALIFETTKPLHAYEGLTVVASFAKGFIRPPGEDEVRAAWLHANRHVIAGVAGLGLVLLYYLVTWVLIGRDPTRGIVIPQFEAPAGLDAAGVRFMRRMRYDERCFTAALVSLAVKGWVRIAETDGEFTLQKLGASPTALSDPERRLQQALFGSATQLELKQKNHARLQAAIEALKQSLATDYDAKLFRTNRRWVAAGLLVSASVLLTMAWFSPGPGIVLMAFIMTWLSVWSFACLQLLENVRRGWRDALRPGVRPFLRVFGFILAIFVTAFAAPFFAGEIAGLYVITLAATIWAAPVAIALGALNWLFLYLLKQPTRAGQTLIDQIDGLRMYLLTAEGDELRRAPDKTPAVFERMLPYAIALGVEHEWSERFDQVLRAAGQADSPTYQPIWYSGRSFSAIGSAGFTSMVSSSLSSAIASSSTSPGSSSGSSGGGSSGGGGGGGGGGGW